MGTVVGETVGVTVGSFVAHWKSKVVVVGSVHGISGPRSRNKVHWPVSEEDECGVNAMVLHCTDCAVRAASVQLLESMLSYVTVNRLNVSVHTPPRKVLLMYC